ncbi:MAG: molybdopterin-dependent oxidoreductase [Acidimicrobiia bacterium]|jgi:hypothetical protein|nr:molybdopterin-dependent oxidoreductase [Acidimicrobiia bacterium]
MRTLEGVRRSGAALAERVGDPAARFTNPVHEARTAAILGIALAVAFTACFTTGVLSHLIQYPPSWFAWPSRPAGFYRVTQGVHVTTGLATIPLLLAKLWVVYPHFTSLPPVRSVGHFFARLALLPLVGGAIFLLVSGVANVARWYPWTFFFPRAHFWAAWITIGALVVHVGVQWATSRAALRRAAVAERDPVLVRATSGERRGFLAGVAGAVGLVWVATSGGTVAVLSPLSALAQRRPGDGPQGLPVNKTAVGAGTEELADDPTWALTVEGRVDTPLRLTAAALAALPQRSATLPIACVEGWSASARWTGVPVRDLLALAGAAGDAEVQVESADDSLYGRSELNRSHAADPDTMLALLVNGEPLHPDHGAPLRLIGPNRPGVMQTKWVTRLVVR